MRERPPQAMLLSALVACVRLPVRPVLSWAVDAKEMTLA